MDFPAHPFWDFALDVYRRPGVSDACLVLQERDRLDVNLLLFVCWTGASGSGLLNRDDIAQCLKAVGPWHEAVVRPMRGVRRILKGGFEGAPKDLNDQLRREIQAREIDAEHIEQLMLAATIQRVPKDSMPASERLRDACRNALSYLAVLGASADAQEKTNLAIILAAAFPDAAPASIHSILDSAAV